MKTRDEWLAELLSYLQSWFEELGFQIPGFQIRSGFPSKGRGAQKTAESWEKQEDGSFIIFVRPDRSDPREVISAVVLEMSKVVVGPKDRHGHLFRFLASSFGLGGGKSERSGDREFLDRVAPIMDAIGALPSPEIAPADLTAAPKQTTRQIKVTCEKCGYVARVSRKWLSEVGPPICPDHGAMTPQWSSKPDHGSVAEEEPDVPS